MRGDAHDRLVVAVPIRHQHEKARALIQQAAPDGFTTPVLFNNWPLTVAEPMAVLLKEALTQIGLRLELIKMPGPNFQAEENKRTAPIVIDRLANWPDYNLFLTFHGIVSVSNVRVGPAPGHEQADRCGPGHVRPGYGAEHVAGSGGAVGHELFVRRSRFACRAAAP